ncbi:D-tyrosyl-tRNA(Tyr) deacylase [Lishizhenia tianjinensis]|uniref:D-aminoacyl-tRNA deacylase n=1 Tax=Lishizhenia tianjinensis TaxID=477690 RepID=A0A1I7BRK7_9FLAO|nr:D-aminoacyl-tRNA deacylase [Lishizhenia tianjinensis]SFT89810.1 D-tyrosyl-tRNA(Tyr) deacylase [Lishizhenia tianjinensis]
MRLVIQRVSSAKVEVDDKVIGKIDKGLLVLIGVEDADTSEDLEWCVKKLIGMRIFSDEEGKMNLSIKDVKGGVLVISQFTLHASTKKGNRPSFIKAGKPDFAKSMYQEFIRLLQGEITQVAQGEFGANMQVSLCNDGPVTITMDSKHKE